jgi:hypothetical protein
MLRKFDELHRHVVQRHERQKYKDNATLDNNELPSIQAEIEQSLSVGDCVKIRTEQNSTYDQSQATRCLLSERDAIE